MKHIPLHDRVIVEPIENESLTKGGIIIPDTVKEKPLKGRILAVGRGMYNQNGELMPMTVQVNDVVLYGKYAGTEMQIDDKIYMIMREQDIFIVLRDE